MAGGIDLAFVARLVAEECRRRGPLCEEGLRRLGIPREVLDVVGGRRYVVLEEEPPEGALAVVRELGLRVCRGPRDTVVVNPEKDRPTMTELEALARVYFRLQGLAEDPYSAIEGARLEGSGEMVFSRVFIDRAFIPVLDCGGSLMVLLSPVLAAELYLALYAYEVIARSGIDVEVVYIDPLLSSLSNYQTVTRDQRVMAASKALAFALTGAPAASLVGGSVGSLVRKLLLKTMQVLPQPTRAAAERLARLSEEGASWRDLARAAVPLAKSAKGIMGRKRWKIMHIGPLTLAAPEGEAGLAIDGVKDLGVSATPEGILVNNRLYTSSEIARVIEVHGGGEE